MSGVLGTMRRTLLSCTAIVQGGVAAAVTGICPADARDLTLLDTARAALAGLHRQEAAALTVSAAVLGFSVVAAILLMRTRVRATAIETRLRTENQSLQNEADRYRSLLFAEPQVLISWAAGDDRPDISGDVALLLPQGSQPHAQQRILAFGTWLHPEQALEMDHAVDALRESGEGFLLNLTTANGPHYRGDRPRHRRAGDRANP